MAGLSKHFASITVGTLVSSGNRQYRVTGRVSVDSVLGVDLETQESKRLRIETVTPITDEDISALRVQKAARDLTAFSESEWAEAQRRFEAIKPLLEDPVRSRACVDAMAAKCDVHAATLYKWLAAYQNANHVSALVPEKRGRKPGSRYLGEQREHIISQAIELTYLTKQRHTVQQVIEDVRRACRLSKLPPPSPNAIRKRIRQLHPAKILRRRGFVSEARNRYEANIGSISGADRPLSIVMVDHTKADIMLVDEINRQPIGRPWLSLAIDVFSRMVVGFYVTFEAPSASSLGLCLANAMCTKMEYLAELGVSGDWPVWGRMAVVHADNGKEFRGNMIKRACEEYGIDLQWRPVLVPEYGGHIERLMGSVATELHKLPGTTQSNPAARKGYDSDAHAVMTLREFERHMAEWIVNVYNQRLHSELDMAPIRKWTLGLMGDDQNPGSGILAKPTDPLRVRLDFMPFYTRSIQTYGILIDNISYYDPVLDPYVNAADPTNPKAKRQFIIRRDPRDISIVYFLDPTTQQYATVRYRNIGYPAISVWELQQALETIRKDGRDSVDEATIFAAVERMRSHIDAATERSKAARRRLQQRPSTSTRSMASPAGHVAAPSGAAASSVHSAMIRSPTSKPAADLFSEPILPFDEVMTER